MNDISLQQIEVFLTVAEQLNLSEAAKDLFLSQSGVSKWISRLEKNLNMQLFIRTNRGVELTENGQFLYEELKPLYGRLNSTIQNIRDIFHMTENIIKIGCMDSPEAINALKDAMTSIDNMDSDKIVRIHLYSFKDLREELICGNLDCIVAYSIGFGEYLNISTKSIKKVDTYLAISKDNPIAASDYFPSAETLSNETLYLLSFAEMEEPERRAIKICESIGFKPKEIKYLPTFLSLELALKNNRGFCISGSDIQEHFKDDIKLFKIDTPPREQSVIVAWNDKNASDATRNFVNMLPCSD